MDLLCWEELDMGYSLIAGVSESRSAFELLHQSFGENAQVFPNHSIGWQGGAVQVNVYWHELPGIWGVFERRPPREDKGSHRFWNCFGIANPSENRILNITVELNPPHEGEDRRTAGVFLRDNNDRVFVGHSGRLGGGRPGIGQRPFRQFSQDLQWQEILTPKGMREVVVFGPLQDRKFPNILAPFIHTIAEFKESVTMRR